MKRIITGREYKAAYKTRDEKRHIVSERRIAFIWKMQSFNIHIFKEPVKDLFICHAQTAIGSDTNGELGSSISMPPFLDVERRIEDKKEDKEKYGTFNISLIK